MYYTALTESLLHSTKAGATWKLQSLASLPLTPMRRRYRVLPFEKSGRRGRV